MPRTASKSNPTNLLEVDRQRIVIDVDREQTPWTVSLTQLVLDGLPLPPDLEVVLEARAGSSMQRFSLGSIREWDRKRMALDELDLDSLLRFRVLIHAPGNPLLVASCENLRSRSLDDAGSLIAMEPADLGEVAWRLEWSEDEPTLLFNPNFFANARGAIQNPAFCALVLPEVARQIAHRIASAPAVANESGHPLHDWALFFRSIGFNAWPPEEPSDETVSRCASSAASRFAQEMQLGAKLRRVLSDA